MKNKNNVDGQLSFWDIEIPIVSSKVEQIKKEIIEVVKVRNKLTTGQDKIIDKYKVLNEFNKVVQYAGGGVGIELRYGDEFKTVYVNRAGEEEFVTPSQIPVQPIDRIITSKNNYELNEIQIDRLEEFKQKHSLNNYIKRNGDRNVIIKINEKVISINPLGWLLEYSEALYEENEVFEFNKKTMDYTIGDRVEALFGNEKITGKIVKKYENQDSFNIVWNGKHSAFHKSKILRKVA